MSTQSAYNNALRLCIKCELHHYENCDSCFGFGLKAATQLGDETGNGTALVNASEAHEACCEGQGVVDGIACPECGTRIINSTLFVPVGETIHAA